jgi:hypothetical protein
MDMMPSRFTAAALCFHEQVNGDSVLYLIIRIWVLARRGKLPGRSGTARGARLAQSIIVGPGAVLLLVATL